MKLNNCHRNQADELLVRYKVMKMKLARFIRTELGIETSLQIMFSVLLLLFSKSDTRIVQGLEAIFDGGQDFILGISPQVILVLNMIWSILSAWRSYFKGLSATKDHFPLKPILILGMYVCLSLFSNCLACIVYFAPCLGLFNLLRHYQGELFPYTTLTEKEIFNITIESDFVYYSTAKPIPWQSLSRYNYSDPENPIKPPITIYTYFELDTILHGFYLVLLLQTFLIMLTKRFANPMAFKRQNLLQKFTHALENCQIPAPTEDWDDEFGPKADDYVKAQMKVRLEMGLTLLVNLVTHLMMTIPMMILTWNICQRHELLENSIGTFPEEQEAYRLSVAISIMTPIILILSTFFQYWSYNLYNQTYHPFIDLIKDSQGI